MGFLIPWNINTMSIFSLTLKLYEDGEYTHPGYQMEDIIALIRWTLAVRQKCIIRALPVATMSGPTSGDSYIGELYEWGRQIRRWTIGAAEVFHYFAVKSTRLPITVSVPWAGKFLFYYGILLCVAPIYSIVAPFLTTFMLDIQELPKNSYLIPSEAVFNYILIGMLLMQYFWFFVVFLVNRLAEKTFPDSITDETPLIRSAFHWLMSFPTIIAYCLVELWAFVEITIRGKSACQHKASKKDGLVPLKAAENNCNVPSNVARF
uniref:Glycosyltransferase 2-like domain-containing protein n=1 Tax=Plectus sambesii TaxID=2011161 RepID=A0A914WQP5_9BILA